MLKRNKIALATGIALLAGSANAGYTIKINDQDSITFGGYIQGDVRHIDGELSSHAVDDNFWIGAVSEKDLSMTKFSADSSRFNTKFVHGDLSGFIEMDFYGGGGSEVLTNSSNPRLRHAFVKYQNWTVGQTWSTFMNTSALAESADFGGPLNASAFIRQDQIRYTNGAFQVAIENPESYAGDATQDSLPDVVAKYTLKGDWGNVAFSGLARELNTVNGESESAVGFGVSGRINTFGKDDFRFAVHGGNTGRYVGAAAATDLVGDEVEESTSIMASYRHFWTETWRTNVYFGSIETEESDRKRTHIAINIFNNITKELSWGVEVGNFDSDDTSDNPALINVVGDSNYGQFSVKYVL